MRYITCGGFETELIFREGIELPFFATFPLIDDAAGRDILERYHAPYLRLAHERGVGFCAGAPTWRANPDWGERLGYGVRDLARVNAEAVVFMRALVDASPVADTVVAGALGPRGDGYRAGEAMSAEDARRYHAPQIDALAGAGADFVGTASITQVPEAIGIVRAAQDADLPVVMSFTLETDGRLPGGTPLGEAITQVDEATDGAADGFMVNCVHPDHLVPALNTGEPWMLRLTGVRANASRLSHAELNDRTSLDDGDPDDFARSHAPVHDALPGLEILGGCCGTDLRHIDALLRGWGALENRAV